MPINGGFENPDLNFVKKHVPTHGIGKARQHTLWEEEKRRGIVTPGPLTYSSNPRPT